GTQELRKRTEVTMDRDLSQVDGVMGRRHIKRIESGIACLLKHHEIRKRTEKMCGRKTHRRRVMNLELKNSGKDGGDNV
ncbi:MAG: hypothetical protein NTW91_02235, partial [Verrucomicrobia bacterium]|nr:hypothetical protein [Verrucomicrobiota bacterium]